MHVCPKMFQLLQLYRCWRDTIFVYSFHTSYPKLALNLGNVAVIAWLYLSKAVHNWTVLLVVTTGNLLRSATCPHTCSVGLQCSNWKSRKCSVAQRWRFVASTNHRHLETWSAYLVCKDVQGVITESNFTGCPCKCQ